LIIATGSKPNISLAKDAGCKIGETGGIIVNEKSETRLKNIYAVGDCTEYLDFVTKKPVPIGLGSIAVRQGIAAGINAAGGDYKLPNGVLQTRTSEFFGFEIAAVGPINDLMKDMSVVSGKFNGSSLPDYFPGGKPISLKVTVDEKTGRILSAQAVGDNAAQRINTFACAILSGIDVETFRKLETAYAPPIAPTLDTVTLVCDIVSKKLSRKR
jgi:NADH oxidase (H2O2-forming)